MVIVILPLLGFSIFLQILSSPFVVVVGGLHPADGLGLAVGEDGETCHFGHEVGLPQNVSIGKSLPLVGHEPHFVVFEDVSERLHSFIHAHVLGWGLLIFLSLSPFTSLVM